MKTQRLWKSALVLLTGIATVLPNSVMAGDAPVNAEVRKPAVQVRDVSLDADGTLTGYVVDAQGKPEALESVTIHQGRTTVATVKTNEKGQFAAKGLKGGVYQVSSNKGAALFRVWKNGTAPKQASKLALVVNDQGIARAQGEGGLLGLGGGGAGLGGASLATVGIGAGIIAGVTVAVVEATDNSN